MTYLFTCQSLQQRSKFVIDAFLYFVSSVCLLGNRTLLSKVYDVCAKVIEIDNETVTTKLWSSFCDSDSLNATCDDYFANNNVTEIRGIPWVTSVILASNVYCIDGNANTSLKINLQRLNAPLSFREPVW